MKWIIILLLCFPTTIFAKYCPACFATYQAQTIRGQAKLVYSWTNRIMTSKKTAKLSDFKRIFSKNFTMVINGRTVAKGIRGTYQYFYFARKKSKTLESRLEQVIVDRNKVALQYQVISKRRNGKKYRYLIVSILHFKHHKLDTWWEVSHAIPLNG